MKRAFTFFVCVLTAIPLMAQLSSTDIKDASTTGPFPLYFGLGYARSFRHQDLVDMGRDFNTFNNGEGDINKILRGLQAMAGVSIIPDNHHISYVVEARYLWLKRSMCSTGNELALEKSQVSLGGGARFAMFPLVVQVQIGGILRHYRYYTFEVNGQRTAAPFNTILAGGTALTRLALLDPAGTEGGLGVYAEFGYNITSFKNNRGEISDAIRTYDPSHSGSLNADKDYFYFSFGILLPIAIRIR